MSQRLIAVVIASLSIIACGKPQPPSSLGATQDEANRITSSISLKCGETNSSGYIGCNENGDGVFFAPKQNSNEVDFIGIGLNMKKGDFLTLASLYGFSEEDANAVYSKTDGKRTKRRTESFELYSTSGNKFILRQY